MSPAWLGTCHCMQPVGDPSRCEEPKIYPVPVLTLLLSASSLVLPKRSREAHGSVFWALTPPLLATQAQAAALGPPKPKTGAESAQTALCVLHALL